MKLYLDEKLSLGRKLQLSFNLPTEQVSISAEGEVIWAIEKQKREVWVGIKFSQIKREDRLRIISYIKEYLRLKLF